VIDGIIFIALGAWVSLVGLGKVRVSKNPEAGAAWLAKWGIVFRIGGPIMIVVGIVKIVASFAR
jgi:hypothetical protein